jgi:hypothetical protein
MLRVGWEPPFGGYLQERVRTVANEPYYGGDIRQYSPGVPAPFPYHHYHDLSVEYSRPWKDTTVGGEVLVGRDVFGESFWRLSGFLRYGGDQKTRDDGEVEDESYAGGPNAKGAEVFVDAGVNVNRVHVDLGPGTFPYWTKSDAGPHFALGARRAVSDNNDLGVRAELDEVASHALYGFRAVDFRHRYGDAFALGLFLGVDRYQLATPAYSMYAGIGLQWRDFMRSWHPNWGLGKWDLGLEFRYAQNIARDHVLATDPLTARPDSFYKVESAVFYLSRRF